MQQRPGAPTTLPCLSSCLDLAEALDLAIRLVLDVHI